MTTLIQHAIFTAAAGLMLLVVDRTVRNTYSIRGGFTVRTADVLREKGGKVSLHDDFEPLIWDIIFLSWILMFIYQVTCLFPNSSRGPVYKFGHIPWTFNALAMVGMIAHLIWIMLVHSRYLFSALIVATISLYCLVRALATVLKGLYKKASLLEQAGLTKDIYIMQILVVNAVSVYCTLTFFNVFSIADAFMIKIFKITPNESNIYVLIILALLQVAHVLYDVYHYHWLLRDLVGNYLTMIKICYDLVFYQAATQSHLSKVTALNFLIAFLCLIIKLRSKNSSTKFSYNISKDLSLTV